MRARASDRTGAAIRKLRMSRGWSLAALSEHSGVPVSTLSRFELGQNALNYEKLMRLCRAFEIDLEGLVAREAETAPVAAGRRSVIRSGAGPSTRVGANRGRCGAADLISKTMSPVILDVTAPDLNAHGPLAGHPGEAYVLVLSGSVVLYSRHYAPLALAEGDAVYFDAAGGYALTARAPPAKVVLVASGETAFDG